MNIQHLPFRSKEETTVYGLCNWLLLLFIVIPLSCSAQNNALTHITSVERSDNKGHVIRFHLDATNPSYNLSQPQPFLVQLELKGGGIDTTNIRVDDRSGIITKIDFYSISGGIGVDIFLKEGTFFEAAAYPDRDSKDILLALAKTTEKNLTQNIQDIELFAWSDIEPAKTKVVSEPENKKAAIDTSYQKIKDKIKFDVVVLDAGHGGHDVGATGYRNVYEKDVVLDITKKVGGYIKEYLPDVKVVYTRDDDTFIDLYERGPMANRAEGDLFVSIHANAAGSRQAHGTETYFLGLERSKTALQVMQRENKVINADEDEKKELTQEDLIIYELANSGYIATSERIAGMIQQQFKNRAGRRSRGVKQGRLVVLYNASMPAILVETGFITNPGEANYLKSDYGQSIIASAIFRAIRNYKEQFEKSQHFNVK